MSSDRSVAGPTNRLADATSPYLQQHAGNPVDWWPWCEEALALARAQDRPILLSIGYSACHWCHVMAHESFEDPVTAELMNRLFVNIKVDREERPDLDRIYQTAHQLLARRAGGWPLTVFLTPGGHEPFFVGTYFPPQPRHGLPGFRGLLEGVARAYREQKEAISAQSADLLQALRSLDPQPGGGIPDPGLEDRAVRQLSDRFDADDGGFGRAPKFPHPTSLELLLRRGASVGADGESDQASRHMAVHTLGRMARGGVNDQLGGGFCRYSVDEQWMIPHFEKMLYDNGPLLALYCDAFALTGDALYGDTAAATADWMIREMQSPEGGYYSSLDADSEGQEGRFYCWDRDQVRALLAPDEYAVVAAVYGLDRPANFEGLWHLHGQRTPEEAARRLGRDPGAVRALLGAARARLYAEREGRVHPGRDEKILTAWNALAIKGMARAARVLGRADYLESAEAALGFIRARLWDRDRLLASYRDGRADLDAYLDDHALLLDALLELLQLRWSPADLALAVELAQVLLDRFEDKDAGGFWFTANDHEPLIHRPKPLSDESMPAGNGIAALALQRLGHLLGETRYLESARRVLELAAGAIEQMPYAHATLLMALDEHLSPPETLIIRADADLLEDWRRAAQRGYRPRRLVLAIPGTETGLPGALAGMRPGDGPRAYRCRGTQCEPPVLHIDRL